MGITNISEIKIDDYPDCYALYKVHREKQYMGSLCPREGAWPAEWQSPPQNPHAQVSPTFADTRGSPWILHSADSIIIEKIHQMLTDSAG